MSFIQQKVPTPSGTVNNGQIALATGIGFPPKSLIVDNYTPYWLFIPQCNSYVGPWVVGAVKPLLHMTDQVTVIYQSPFTSSQTPTDIGFFTEFGWTEAVLAPAPGSIIAVNSQNQISNTSDATPLLDYACNVMTVTGTATLIPSTIVARRAVLIQSSKFNNPAGTIYIGDAAVTANDNAHGGIQLSPGMSYPMDVKETFDVYAITDLPNQKLIVAEAK